MARLEHAKLVDRHDLPCLCINERPTSAPEIRQRHSMLRKSGTIRPREATSHLHYSAAIFISVALLAYTVRLAGPEPTVRDFQEQPSVKRM